MVQKLKDKSDTEVARELEQETQSNPVLGLEIDALLGALDALKQAEKSLTTEDKFWFETTIQRELKQIGSGVKYHATLIGDGAIAEGDEAVAVGAGGIYVKGDYVASGGAKFLAPNAAETTHQKNAKARTSYLEKLRRHCQVLPLAALGGEETAEEDITLDSVYIDLDTTLNVKAEDLELVRQGKQKSFKDIDQVKENLEFPVPSRDEKNKVLPVPVLDAVIATSKVVLLGDPGAGKSTFARKLLGLQAAVQLGQIQAIRGISADLLPVMVVLRELVPYLSEVSIDELSGDKQKEALLEVILSYLADELKRNNTEDFVPLMQMALEEWQSLDGSGRIG